MTVLPDNELNGYGHHGQTAILESGRCLGEMIASKLGAHAQHDFAVLNGAKRSGRFREELNYARTGCELYQRRSTGEHNASRGAEIDEDS